MKRDMVSLPVCVLYTQKYSALSLFPPPPLPSPPLPSPPLPSLPLSLPLSLSVRMSLFELLVLTVSVYNYNCVHHIAHLHPTRPILLLFVKSCIYVETSPVIIFMMQYYVIIFMALSVYSDIIILTGCFSHNYLKIQNSSFCVSIIKVM